MTHLPSAGAHPTPTTNPDGAPGDFCTILSEPKKSEREERYGDFLLSLKLIANRLVVHLRSEHAQHITTPNNAIRVALAATQMAHGGIPRYGDRSSTDDGSSIPSPDSWVFRTAGIYDPVERSPKTDVVELETSTNVW